MFKWVIYSILALFSMRAGACDLSIGVGQTFRMITSDSSSTDGGKVISAKCDWDRKWFVGADYFTKQRIFDKTLTIDPYAMLTISRRWSMSPESTRLPPFFQFGLSFKESESCKSTDYTNCNALVPSPVSVSFGIGFTTKHLEFVLRHTSNAGTSKPNGGQDSLVMFYRF